MGRLGPVEEFAGQPLPMSAEKPPVDDGRFLPLGSGRAVTWEDMSRGMAPVDDFTGVPLPLLQTDVPLHIIKDHRLRKEFCREDGHHAFFENHEFTTEGGRVLRHSRLQYGSRWNHARYHMMFQGLEWRPQTEIDEFKVAVLAVAGYVPEFAVDVSGARPQIKRLHPWEHRKLVEQDVFPEKRYSNQTGRDLNQLNRGTFFMKQAIHQRFDHVKNYLLEEFLETSDPERRLRAGLIIVDMGFLRATDEISEVYKIARREGQIHPARPRHPVGFLRSVVEGYQADYFKTLAREIRRQDTAA